MGIRSSIYQSLAASDENPKYQRKRNLFVSVVGDKGVGKSSMIHLISHGVLPKPKQIHHKRDSPYYKKITLTNQRTLELTMLDTNGDSHIQRSETKNYEWNELTIVVYDQSMDPQDVEETIARWVQFGRLSSCTVRETVVFGNKSDIVNSKTREEALRVTASLGVSHFEVSTLDKASVDSALLAAIDDLSNTVQIGLPPGYYIGGPAIPGEEEVVGRPLAAVRLVPASQTAAE